MDPWTLAFYCLGPDPSSYVLRLIDIEGKKVSIRFVSVALFLFVLTCTIIDKCSLLAEMTTKFNKDMYARMRNKKDEPLSAIRIKSICITNRGASILAAFPSSPTYVLVGTASPTRLVEGLTPRNKRLRVGDKQKEKVNSRPSSIWDDAGVSVARAQDIFSADEMKVFLGCQQMTLRGIIFTSLSR